MLDTDRTSVSIYSATKFALEHQTWGNINCPLMSISHLAFILSNHSHYMGINITVLQATCTSVFQEVLLGTRISGLTTDRSTDNLQHDCCILQNFWEILLNIEYPGRNTLMV